MVKLLLALGIGVLTPVWASESCSYHLKKSLITVSLANLLVFEVQNNRVVSVETAGSSPVVLRVLPDGGLYGEVKAPHPELAAGLQFQVGNLIQTTCPNGTFRILPQEFQDFKAGYYYVRYMPAPQDVESVAFLARMSAQINHPLLGRRPTNSQRN